MANIEGTYELTKSDKFDEYMEAVGVGWSTRKMASLLKPTTEIKKEGDQITIKTISSFKTTELKFKLGEKFKEETADGRKCDSIIVMEGDSKMKHNQICNGQDLVMYREFTPDQMVVTLHGPVIPDKEKIVCVRTYKKKTA